MSRYPLYERLARSNAASNDELLGLFLDYTTEKKLELYPAQEEAILALYEGRNVILNTPTGSGDRKSTRLNSSHSSVSRMPSSA